MAQAGLHAYISLKSKKWVPDKKFLFISFLLGSIIPDIDILFSAIASYYMPLNKAVEIFHRTFTHSLISVAALYLIFLIIYEIKKNELILNIAYGLTAGIIFHLLIDIVLWFNTIDLFWPLPIPKINLWFKFTIQNNIINTLLALEFIFFRLFASKLIDIIINKPLNNAYYIKYLGYWMKIEIILFILFIISIQIIPSFSLIVFGIFYIPSLLMLIFSTWNLRDSID
tara:strand:- start:123 stop:803 length:681 start_codon:yes stop_codon:yes gene_type:complete